MFTLTFVTLTSFLITRYMYKRSKGVSKEVLYEYSMLMFLLFIVFGLISLILMLIK